MKFTVLFLSLFFTFFLVDAQTKTQPKKGKATAKKGAVKPKAAKPKVAIPVAESFATLKINANADAKVFVDNELKGVSNPTKSLKVAIKEVGAYKVKVVSTYNAKDFIEKTVDVTTKGQLLVDFDLAPLVAARQQAEEEENKKKPMKTKYAGTLRFVEGGEFFMGCTFEQTDYCEGVEKPAHKVKLKNYYISETEVTQAQWEELMGDNPSKFRNCDNCPVEMVSYGDALRFIDELNKKEGGKKFRLPTEAEWEYAARGGNKPHKQLYSGTAIDMGSSGWFKDNSGAKTHEVKTKEPNNLGLYDMSGNVNEWCADVDGLYSADFAENPRNMDGPKYNVIRGGAWSDLSVDCRVSTRDKENPKNRFETIGFRLVREY